MDALRRLSPGGTTADGTASFSAPAATGLAIAVVALLARLRGGGVGLTSPAWTLLLVATLALAALACNRLGVVAARLRVLAWACVAASGATSLFGLAAPSIEAVVTYGPLAASALLLLVSPRSGRARTVQGPDVSPPSDTPAQTPQPDTHARGRELAAADRVRASLERDVGSLQDAVASANRRSVALEDEAVRLELQLSEARLRGQASDGRVAELRTELACAQDELDRRRQQSGALRRQLRTAESALDGQRRHMAAAAQLAAVLHPSLSQRFAVEQVLAWRSTWRAVLLVRDRAKAPDEVRVLKVTGTAPLRDAHARRLQREVDVALHLDSRHLARVHDHGQTEPGVDGGAQVWAVFECIAHADIERWFMARRGASVRDALLTTRAIATALLVLHDSGLPHGDVKYDNLGVRDDGMVVLLDLALLQRWDRSLDEVDRRERLWSLYFAAPELVAHGIRTEAGDLYALGSILRGLLGAGHPHDHGLAGDPDARRTWAVRVITGESEPLLARVACMPAAVATLADALLAHDPEARPTARDVIARIDAFLDDPDLGPVLDTALGAVRSRGVDASTAPWDHAAKGGGAGPAPTRFGDTEPLTPEEDA